MSLPVIVGNLSLVLGCLGCLGKALEYNYKLVAPKIVFGRFYFPHRMLIRRFRFIAHNDRLKILRRLAS
jgi:hypothetical protein